MSRLIFLSISTSALLLSCSERSDFKQVNTDIICQYDSDRAVEPGFLLELSVEKGGRTCFHDQKKLLFLPSNDRRKCDDVQHFGSGRPLDERTATDQFISCSAISTPSAAYAGAGVIYFLMMDNSRTDDSEMVKMSMDVRALATNDGLRAYHVGFYSRMLCIETDDIEDVIEHLNKMIDSPMDPAIKMVRAPMKSCEAVSEETGNGSWPVFSINRG